MSVGASLAQVGPESSGVREFTSDTILRGWMASDSAAAALGIGVLRRRPLPEGSQEVRVWTGIALGVPHELTRLTRRGGRVDGMLALFWFVHGEEHRSHAGRPMVPTDAVIRHNLAGQCGPPRRAGDTEACQARLEGRPNWGVVWDSLERLGVWTLPDQEELPADSFMTLDGWSMTVEVRDGKRYRSYAYSNPDAHRHPAQVAATAIANAGGAVWHLMPPPSRRLSYQGEVRIQRDWNEFRACGTTEAWAIQGSLGPRLDSLHMSLSRDSSHTMISPRDTSGRRYYAELRGMLAYPGLIRSWGAPYDDMLEVDSVLAIRDAVPRGC